MEGEKHFLRRFKYYEFFSFHSVPEMQLQASRCSTLDTLALVLITNKNDVILYYCTLDSSAVSVWQKWAYGLVFILGRYIDERSTDLKSALNFRPVS